MIYFNRCPANFILCWVRLRTYEATAGIPNSVNQSVRITPRSAQLKYNMPVADGAAAACPKTESILEFRPTRVESVERLFEFSDFSANGLKSNAVAHNRIVFQGRPFGAQT